MPTDSSRLALGCHWAGWVAPTVSTDGCRWDHVPVDASHNACHPQAEPTIWRRIQVPDRYSFWDLHCAVTDSLGWLDYHLHQFEIVWPESGETDIIGIPDDEGFDDQETLPGWELSIVDYFTRENPACEYEYDFGDGWRHTVVLEEILPREDGVVYPRGIAGERACPPEDVGGPWGYEGFLKSIRYMNSPDHDRLLEWVGGWFDPDWFDVDLIRFGNPQKRWRYSTRPSSRSRTSSPRNGP